MFLILNIVWTLNFCAKFKKIIIIIIIIIIKQEKRRAHSCEHILSVSHPSHSFRNSTCVVSGDPFCHFFIQQIPHGISPRGFRRWRFCLVPKPQLIISPRGPFSYHDSVRFSSNWVSNTRPHFHHASTPCGFPVPNKAFCPFFIQKIKCREFF
jgi:hypothetical protein